MDKNRRNLLLAAGAGVVVLACCVCLVLGVVVYSYQEQILSLLGLAPSQRVARMLPQDTQLYMSINPNLQNVAGYENIKKHYLDNPDIQELLDEFQADVQEEADITFEDDIKPWLGTEIAMAFPDLTATIDNPSDTPALVLAAETINQEASSNFINKVIAEAEKDDEPFTEEVYEEVILYAQEDQFSGETFFLTTFDDFVVAGSDKGLITEMIDRSQGKNTGPSLVDSERFKKITGAVPGEAIMLMYMAPTGFFDAILEESAVQMPPESVQDLKAFEAMAMAGTLQPNGIQLDVAVSFDMENMSEQMKAAFDTPASPNQVLNNIPAEALFVYNTNNLNNIWQNSKRSLEANPDFSEGLQDLEQELGFNLEDDIFGWMTGEVAVVMVEAAPPDEFSPPLGGYLLIGTDNVDTAQSSVDKVVGSLEEQGMMPPLDTETVQGVELKVFRDFNEDIQGGYGFYNNYFLMAYLPDAIKAATNAGQNPLPDSQNFQAVQNRLPAENYGYFYADVDRIRAVAEGQLSDFDREDYEKYAQPFLAPIRALGAAGQAGLSREDGLSKGVFFILISDE